MDKVGENARGAAVLYGYLAVTMPSMMGADLGNRYAYGVAPGSAALVTGVQVGRHGDQAARRRAGVAAACKVGARSGKSWRWASALVIPGGMP